MGIDMPRVTRKAIVLTVAATTAAGLMSVGTTGAEAARQAAPDQNAVLHVKINKNGTQISGPTSFAAGRVKLSVEAVGKDRGAEIIQLHSGYTFSDLRADIKKF